MRSLTPAERKLDSPLAELLAGPVDGAWTFHVADISGLDSGNIRAVSLHVGGFVSG